MRPFLVDVDPFCHLVFNQPLECCSWISRLSPQPSVSLWVTSPSEKAFIPTAWLLTFYGWLPTLYSQRFSPTFPNFCWLFPLKVFTSTSNPSCLQLNSPILHIFMNHLMLFLLRMRRVILHSVLFFKLHIESGTRARFILCDTHVICNTFPSIHALSIFVQVPVISLLTTLWKHGKNSLNVV